MDFYDKITNCVTFTSAVELMKGINFLSDKKVDVESCRLTLRGLRFKAIDGKHFTYTNSTNILKGLKEDFEIPVDLNKSYRRGKVVKLYLTEYLNSSFKEDLKEDSALHPTQEVDDTKQDTTPTIRLSREDLYKLYDEEDKKGSKDRLETFVKETTGIDLNKRSSFDNMVNEYFKLSK